MQNRLGSYEFTGPDDGVVPELSYEDINKIFVIFAKLRERPDWREYLQKFYMGEITTAEDLEALPEPKAVPAEVPEEVSKANEAKTADSVIESLDEDEGEFPDGAQLFGGDYATDGPEGESSPEEAAAGESDAHELHAVPGQDSDASPPNDEEADAVLHEVPVVHHDGAPELEPPPPSDAVTP
jgi:hypothetical protein